MTDFSVPLAVPEENDEAENSSLTWPIIGGLSMISFMMLIAITTWISLVTDPLGGEPHVSVTVIALEGVVDPTQVGIAGVRPSITPDPEDDRGIQTEINRPAKTQMPDEAMMPEQQEGPLVKNSFEGVRGVDTTRLSVFPLEGLTERNEYGVIPKRAGDGSSAFTAYARPLEFVPEGPKIALIVGGVGLSESLTEQALTVLPTTTALAITPYGSSVERWNRLSRENGFELLLETPLEPFNYPENDPGPHTLLVDNDPKDNMQRLGWLMAQLNNYIGLVPTMGSRFTADERALTELMSILQERGLSYIDTGESVRSLAPRIAKGVSSNESGRFPFVRVDVILDSQPGQQTIERKLTQLEELSRSRGVAIGYVRNGQAALKTIVDWAKLSSRRGVTLIPLSAAIRLTK